MIILGAMQKGVLRPIAKDDLFSWSRWTFAVKGRWRARIANILWAEGETAVLAYRHALRDFGIDWSAHCGVVRQHVACSGSGGGAGQPPHDIRYVQGNRVS